MLEALSKLDGQLFLFLNGIHSPIFDIIMWYASNIVIWIPLYFWFLWLLYKEYSDDYWKVLLMAVALIVITDQTANLAKQGFERLRPSHNPAFTDLLHIMNDYRGGTYGYFSGHATSSFAVATFVSLMVGRRWKYVLFVAFAYALLVSYSRIYLGVHYPGDVLTGALFGSFSAFLMVLLFRYLRKQKPMQ